MDHNNRVSFSIPLCIGVAGPRLVAAFCVAVHSFVANTSARIGVPILLTSATAALCAFLNWDFDTVPPWRSSAGGSPVQAALLIVRLCVFSLSLLPRSPALAASVPSAPTKRPSKPACPLGASGAACAAACKLCRLVVLLACATTAICASLDWVFVTVPPYKESASGSPVQDTLLIVCLFFALAGVSFALLSACCSGFIGSD